MTTDPNNPDTDGDGYSDYDEMKEKKPNPLITNITQVSSLSRPEYINIIDESENVSFGGNQGWFGNDKIREWGCGLISSCDILIYLGITHYEKYYFVPRVAYSLDDKIIYNTYYDFVQYYYENYLFILEGNDTLGTEIAKVLEQYMSDYGIEAKVNWANLDDPWSYTKVGIASAIPYLNNKFGINIGSLDADYNVELRSQYAVLDGINEMLDDDIPAMLAIGPYCTEYVFLFDSIEDIKSGTYSHETKGHYVTVTATYYDDIANDYYLEISSWGKNIIFHIEILPTKKMFIQVKRG